MTEKYKEYINQWQQMELYIENDKIDYYGLIEFIVNKIFEYNIIHTGEIELNEKISILNEEEIVPIEIIELFNLISSPQYNDKGLEDNLLQWFYSEYKNYENIINSYGDKVFEFYGTTKNEKNINKEKFNIGFKYKNKIFINDNIYPKLENNEQERYDKNLFRKFGRKKWRLPCMKIRK